MQTDINKFNKRRNCPVIEQNEADIETANRIFNTFLIESVKRYVKNGETSDLNGKQKIYH